MSDKLVSLKAVITAINEGFLTRAELRRKIMLISPVEQPMSAAEYHLIKRRMCKNCPVCPLNEAAINLFIDCKRFEREFPNEAIAIVEKWAREHPEERSEQ